jgi:hypothetical protein
MYTNYLPELLLDLGDYGDVTAEGEFIKSGNIFKDYPSLRDEAETCKQSVGTPRYLEMRERTCNEEARTNTPPNNSVEKYPQ